MVDSLETILVKARAAQAAGNSAAAQALYQSVLTLEPDHSEALNVVGMLLAERGAIEEGMRYLDRAIAADDRIARSYFNRGMLFERSQRYVEALEDYNQCTKRDKIFTLAYTGRGTVLTHLGRFDEALENYQRMIDMFPSYADGYFQLGNLLHHLKRHNEALQQFDFAIKMGPVKASYHYSKGTVYQALNRAAEAADCFKKAIAQQPDHAHACNDLGLVLHKLGQFDEALASYDKAIAIDPQFAAPLSNKGMLLDHLRRYEEALACYKMAIILKPDVALFHNNRGFTLQELCRYGDAIAAYDEAIRLAPQHAGAHFNKACALLVQGNHAEGWKEFEWRWKPVFTSPEWTGEQDIKGKTILLACEQGMGDAIQFCRYIPKVQALGAEVILRVHRPLMKLFETLPYNVNLVALGDKELPHDFHGLLMSMPRIFDTITMEIPYLFADSPKLEEWKNRLGALSAKKRVGLVWAGDPAYKNNHNRSLGLAHLKALLEQADNVEFHALQKDISAEEYALLREHNVVIHSQLLNDFTDTAAIIELMDVVVTVCTSVAHLAGAMGKPTWIMLCYAADWRWYIERSDSPWYPAARLFRQQAPADWLPVVANIADKLKKDL